jgi:SAM-dependent methyltransferase
MTFARSRTTAAHHEARAAEHDDWYTHRNLRTRDRPGWQEELEEVLAFLRGLPPARTLDVGCGTGFLTRHLPGFVVGLDRDPAMVAAAQPRLPDGLALVGDALRLPFADGSFDRIFASHFYGRLLPHDRAAFLRETARVAEELVTVESMVPAGLAEQERQELALDADSSGQPLERSLAPEQLADELDATVLFAGTWLVVARATLTDVAKALQPIAAMLDLRAREGNRSNP